MAATFKLSMTFRWKSGASDNLVCDDVEEGMVRTFMNAAGGPSNPDGPKSEWFNAPAIAIIFRFVIGNGIRAGDVFFIGNHLVNCCEVAAMTVTVQRNL